MTGRSTPPTRGATATPFRSFLRLRCVTSSHSPCSSHSRLPTERCVKASLNILSLYGDRVPYNVCRNLEWQVQRHTILVGAHTPHT
eukprot:5519330-Prymnesium_polylepis.2